jgi:hypothetical protein
MLAMSYDAYSRCDWICPVGQQGYEQRFGPDIPPYHRYGGFNHQVRNFRHMISVNVVFYFFALDYEE